MASPPIANRRRPRVLLWGLTLLVLAIVATLSVGGERYGTFLAGELEASARSHGLLLSIEKLKLGLLRNTAERISLAIPRTFVSISVNAIEARPAWLRVLLLEGGGTVVAKPYDGLCQLRGRYTLLSGAEYVDGTCRGIDLSQHPQINGLGVTAGKISLEEFQASWRRGALVAASARLTLQGLEKPNQTSLPLRLGEGELPLLLPAVTGFDGSVRVLSDAQQLRFDELSSKSSLGEIAGGAALRRASHGNLSEITGEFKVHLSDQGARVFADWLPLLSNGTLTAQSRTFAVTLQGPISRPGTLALRPLP